jgi:outer membrane protein OmpA-like peptidoglycan-associated protein
MIAKLLAVVSALGFPILCLNCIPTHSLQIASLLQSTVSASLAAAPVRGVTVKADGRDMTLTGRVASEADKTKAYSLAMLIAGVRTVDNQLTVQPEAKIIQTQINQILLSKKIEFETGKNILLPASIPVLTEVLAVLEQAPVLTLEIDGHTDNSGVAADNKVLSQARAQAVVDWLAQHGVAKDRMKAAGFGPDKPLVPNTTLEGRAKNRRVEIVAANQ